MFVLTFLAVDFFFNFCLEGRLNREKLFIASKSVPAVIKATDVYTRAPGLVKFFYTNALGRMLAPLATHSKAMSRIVGSYADSKMSRKVVAAFAQSYHINQDEMEKPLNQYKTLNEFFSRALKPGARFFDQSSCAVCSPADGAVFVVSALSASTTFLIKGARFDLAKFLSSADQAARMHGGTVLIIRLSPGDYHRYHVPFALSAEPFKSVHGYLDSVDPLVYAAGSKPLEHNERHVISYRAEAGFEGALVVVGALCVGRIFETYQPEKRLTKGAQLGYFQLGGSTIVLVLPAGVVRVRADIVRNSGNGEETRVKAGDRIAEIC